MTSLSHHAPHPCQRCGSETWTDVDYSGCSDCREPAESDAKPSVFQFPAQASHWMRQWAATLTYEREKLEAAADMLDGVAADYLSLRRELATIFGAVQPRDGETWNAAMLGRITEKLVEEHTDGYIARGDEIAAEHSL